MLGGARRFMPLLGRRVGGNHSWVRALSSAVGIFDGYAPTGSVGSEIQILGNGDNVLKPGSTVVIPYSEVKRDLTLVQKAHDLLRSQGLLPRYMKLSTGSVVDKVRQIIEMHKMADVVWSLEVGDVLDSRAIGLLSALQERESWVPKKDALLLGPTGYLVDSAASSIFSGVINVPVLSQVRGNQILNTLMQGGALSFALEYGNRQARDFGSTESGVVVGDGSALAVAGDLFCDGKTVVLTGYTSVDDTYRAATNAARQGAVAVMTPNLPNSHAMIENIQRRGFGIPFFLYPPAAPFCLEGRSSFVAGTGCTHFRHQLMVDQRERHVVHQEVHLSKKEREDMEHLEKGLRALSPGASQPGWRSAEQNRAQHSTGARDK